MNSGSGMMRIGVTVPIISIIAIFLVLNMFFGAWILALPLAAAAAFSNFLSWCQPPGQTKPEF